MTDRWRRMRPILCLLVLAACSHPDPGISRERAKAIFASLGVQDIVLSPEPDGWLVSGDDGPNTYRVKAKITRDGVLKDLSPDEQANQDVTSSAP
jgi:hypothetical protein